MSHNYNKIQQNNNEMSGLESLQLQPSSSHNIIDAEMSDGGSHTFDNNLRKPPPISFQGSTPTFKIPIRKEQLCDVPKGDENQNQFYVKDRYNLNTLSSEVISQELDRVGQKLQGGGNKCMEIINNEYFDILYSVIYYLDDLESKKRKKILSILQQGLKNLKHYIDVRKMIEYGESNFVSADAPEQYDLPQYKVLFVIQNSLKAYIYLITWFMSDYSKLRGTKEVKSKSKKGRVTNLTPAQEQEINVLILAQKDCLKLFSQLLDYNIHVFWPSHKIEEDFVNLFIKCGFDMLENQNNIKSLEMKQSLFDMIQKCMQNFGSDLKYMLSQNTTKIINLLYNQENLAKPLSEFVGIVAERQDSQLANEIIRDLTKEIFHNDSQNETTGIKNVGKFVSKLSKQAPKAVYLNIGNLLGFFDCESHLLRQSLIKVLSNIIQKILCQEANIDPKDAMIFAQTKIKFLELLLKRFLDRSSFCRIKVMKVFVKLTEENLVPRHMYLGLFSAVIGRFKDQTMLVRKGALKLFQQMFIIFGLIFNVNHKDGERFLEQDQIKAELKEASKDYSEAKKNLDSIKKFLEQLKVNKQKQYQCNDAAQLQAILDQDQDFQGYVMKLRNSQDAFGKADFIKTTYTDYQDFLVGVEDALKILSIMLTSKSIADTIEAIKVFKLLKQYGISKADQGIRKMLTLVYSKDEQIVNVVVETYEQLYFDRDLSSSQKAKNLFYLMREATLTDITCIEELLKKLIQKDSFDRDVLKQLWISYAKIFENTFQNTESISTEEQRRRLYEARLEQRSAIQLLRMISSQRPKVILEFKENLKVSSIKFAEFENPDFIIMKEAILLFENILIEQSRKSKEVELTISSDDKTYIYKLTKVLSQTFGTSDLEWFCATETVLNMLFSIKSRISHTYSKLFIETLVSKLYVSSDQQARRSQYQSSVQQQQNNEIIQSIDGIAMRQDVSEIHYAQIFFVAGHISIKLLTFVEQMEIDLKKAVKDSYESKKLSKKNKSTNQNQNSDDEEDDEKNKDDDLAQITGGKDAEIEQYCQMLQKLTDDKLIQEGVMGKFLDPILQVVQMALQRYEVSGAQNIKQLQQTVPEIVIMERSAILALTKYMCVSSKIALENLDLIFRLLNSKIDFGVKTNIIVSLGDLFNRFPNILNEKTGEIFKLLHDEQNHVRRQALMVITHLVLNDMLKIKGEIVDICMLLEDPDEIIKNNVTLFLNELHSKGQNIIYNLFPNAISRLSQEFPNLSTEEFENISRNLLNYIHGDKQMAAIVEKLCQKLKHNVSEQNKIEWRNTAYCLTQIKYNEKIFMKLLEQYECWKERMLDSPDVKQYFNVILQNCKKLSNLREKVDDFDAKINSDEVMQAQIKKEKMAQKKKRFEDQQASQNELNSSSLNNNNASKKRSNAQFQQQPNLNLLENNLMDQANVRNSSQNDRPPSFGGQNLRKAVDRGAKNQSNKNHNEDMEYYDEMED